jgi:hypothetical protein
MHGSHLPIGCGVALHTPGHTPGSMSFWFADAKLLIAGDTLFRRGIGRGAGTSKPSYVRSSSVYTVLMKRRRLYPVTVQTLCWEMKCAKTPSSAPERHSGPVKELLSPGML